MSGGRTRNTLRTVLLAASLVALAACAGQGPVQRVQGVPPIDRTPVANLDTSVFSLGVFIASDGARLPYRLLAPLNLQAGQRYPLVLQLHGSGGIGQDNQMQLDALAKAWALPDNRARYAAFVLVPQVSVRSANYDDPQHPGNAVASPVLGAVMELLDEVIAQQPVDTARVYASGFSMGGSATWLSPVLRPGRFAAIVPVGAIAPADADASMLMDVPVLALHGDADSENPIAADRRLIATLHARGHRQVRLREYAGLAHHVPGDALPGTWWRDWLFAQRRPTPPSP